MAKELPYFQFEPAAWKFGKVQRCSNSAKGAFIDMCAAYWNANCKMTIEDAELDYGVDDVAELVNKRVIVPVDGNISITFLDQQYESIIEKSKKLSEAGKRSGKARQSKVKPKLTKVEPTLNLPSAKAEPPSTQSEQIRVDNIRVENIPPKSPQGDGVDAEILYRQIDKIYPGIKAKYPLRAYAEAKIDAGAMWPDDETLIKRVKAYLRDCEKQDRKVCHFATFWKEGYWKEPRRS